MQKIVSRAQPVKQASVSHWALERMREAKEHKAEALDLSAVSREDEGLLQLIPLVVMEPVVRE